MGNGIQEDAPIVMQLCPKPGQFGFRKGGGSREEKLKGLSPLGFSSPAASTPT